MSASAVGSTIRVSERKPARHAGLDRASGELVGSVFYGKLLSQMRDSKIKGKYGHGGRGEDVFSAQLHGLLAERIGSADRSGLKESVYKRLVRQQEAMDRLTVRMKEGVTA